MEPPTSELSAPEEPLSIVDKIVLRTSSRNVFLMGGGGTGKTHTLRQLAAVLAENGKRVACTATTGVAAITLNQPERKISASTLHRWAGIRLGQGSAENLAKGVLDSRKATERWRQCDVLIVDEVSMLGGKLLDKLEFVARRVRKSQEVFGGLRLVVSGDLLQLPPIKEEWVFAAAAWALLDFATFVFAECKRFSDVAYFELLKRARRGALTKADVRVLDGRREAYRELFRAQGGIEGFVVKPTFIYSKKVDVEAFNRAELAKLPGAEEVYRAIDSFSPRAYDAAASDYQSRLDDAAPASISLKPGAQVMLKVNLDVEAGLVNGTRGVVVRAGTDVEILTRDGAKVLVSRHAWAITDKRGSAVRSQIPLILAWSCTIHRVQGATIDSAICDVGDEVFCPGQAYVALSRVRDLEGLYLSSFSPKKVYADPGALAQTLALEQEDYSGLGVDEEWGTEE